jgi:hypothetical protein
MKKLKDGQSDLLQNCRVGRSCCADQISVFINGFWVITQKLQFYPYVLFINMAAMMVGRQGHRTQLLKGTPKDDSGQVWFKLAQWFQRRRFFKKFTDGRQMMATAHMTLWVRWAKKGGYPLMSSCLLLFYFCTAG